MKKMITFLGMALMVSSAFAQWQNRGGNGPAYDNRNDKRYDNNYRSSSLVIKAFTEKRFTVMIDDMRFELNGNYGNRRNDNFINVGAINPGKHTITVYETRSGFFGNRQKVVYNSFAFFKPGVETTVSVNNYGQVNFSEMEMYGYGRKDNGKHRGHDRDDDDGWRH